MGIELLNAAAAAAGFAMVSAEDGSDGLTMGTPMQEAATIEAATSEQGGTSGLTLGARVSELLDSIRGRS